MPDSSDPTADLFAVTVRGIAEPNRAHTALRKQGPVVRVDAPAGGSVWIITDDTLAREALVDPRIVKDPASAPKGWNQRTAGLEPPASAQLSLTTSDGSVHTRLRQAHAPLFTARRMRDHTDRITVIARELLTGLAATGETVDLMADFTTRFPLTVVFDLLGIPLDLIDDAAAACKRMLSDDPAERGMAIAALAELSGAGLSDSQDGLATELREQLPDKITDQDLQYLLFGLIFAGQLTSDAALGFLLAHVLHGDLDRDAENGTTIDEFVQELLRLHPPAPFTLWRFTTTEIELRGTRIPANSPVLIDILGTNTDPNRSEGPDLTFGAGAHYCIGAQLAQLELRTVVEVLQADFPKASLTVPFADLRQADLGDNQGSRLTALPVTLRS